MSVIVTISGSPTVPSRTDAVVDHLARRGQVRGHQVHDVALRDLPADALVRGQVDHPAVAEAIAWVKRADAVIIGTPIFQAAYSGLLKIFLDVLPRGAFAGKDVLPIATGGSLAHAAVVDYALVPVLRALQPGFLAQGRFVHAPQVVLHPGGGAVLAPEALNDLGRVGSEFVARIERREVSPVPAQGEPVAREVEIDDPALGPMLEELKVEYGTRYASGTPNELLTEVPIEDFSRENGGAFVLLERKGVAVAGGALRRHSRDVAEVKRMWTAHSVRRQGLARRVLVELEEQAGRLGYSRLYLTTGPRQPEARELYLSSGYRQLFDTDAAPNGPLPFEKSLVRAAALAG
ncbi:GNAT family N-acetyltransferase [Dermacoccaceae bacterium W4C1]